MDLGTWHRTRHGSSPKEGARCQWAPELGNLSCRRRRSPGPPGPPGEEQFRDPPLVDACTLPAAEMPRQALCTDVRQLRSRVQAPPAASCKLPLLDRPPARFLTICAVTYRTNQWLCGRPEAALSAPYGQGRSLPSHLGHRRAPAPSDPLQNVPSGRNAQYFPVLFRGTGVEEHSQRNRPALSQFQPEANLLCPHPRLTDLESHLSLSFSSHPLSPRFSKDSYSWKAPSPQAGTPSYPLPSPSYVDRHLLSFFSGTDGQTAHLRECQVVRSRGRKPGGLDLPWPRAG